MEFEEWKAKVCERSEPFTPWNLSDVKAAWDHQQEKIDKLQATLDKHGIRNYEGVRPL